MRVATITREAFVQRFGGLADGVPTEELDALIAELEVQEAAAGEALIAEGTVTDAVFLVWEGELDVFVDSALGAQKLGSVGPGEYLGEVSLIDPGRATASVITQEGCTALRLSREAFDRLRRERTVLAAALLDQFLRVLAARVRAATIRLGSDDATVKWPSDLLRAHATLYREAG